MQINRLGKKLWQPFFYGVLLPKNRRKKQKDLKPVYYFELCYWAVLSYNQRKKKRGLTKHFRQWPADHLFVYIYLYVVILQRHWTTLYAGAV